MQARFFATVALTVGCLAASAASSAAVTTTNFSGTVNGGTFVGQLIADWDTGALTAFYADVTGSNGTTTRYSVQHDWDRIEVVDNPGDRGLNGATQYWRDGHTSHYDGWFSWDFTVSRYQRIGGVLTVVPDPKWEMYLDLADKRWLYLETDGRVVPCGTRTCWEYTRTFSVWGQITAISSEQEPGTAPEPTTLALLGLGLAGLAARRRRSRSH